MIGYLFHAPVLRGLGLASGVAPFPKVFCESDGYEPFAARFAVHAVDAQGQSQRMDLTPECYAGMRGPYNRRNVIGAALAYAPRLPDELRDHLYQQLMQKDSPLREELGIPQDWRDLRVVINARSGEATPSWEYALSH